MVQVGMHYRRTYIRGDYSASVFNICCRCKWKSFLASKYSLCVSQADIYCKRDWCSSSVSFWCLSDCVVINYVDMCGAPLL